MSSGHGTRASHLQGGEMSRAMIAGLTLMAVAACGRGDKGDVATADSLSRDLQRAPVDTSAELNDRPATADRPTATAPATTPRTRTSPTRPTSRPSSPTPSASAPAPTAPVARSLAAGTTLTAATNAEIRSNKNKVGDTVTATIADDVKDGSGHVVIPAGS